jgi:hypothetical protein
VASAVGDSNEDLRVLRKFGTDFEDDTALNVERDDGVNAIHSAHDCGLARFFVATTK